MFTQGKWEAEQQKNLASGKYEWVIKVKEDEIKSRVIATTPYASKYNDHQDNAHLIESAPDMYEALKALVDKSRDTEAFGSGEITDAVIALRKAEGKE